MSVPKDKNSGLIGTKEVARRLGMTTTTVLKLVRAGRIPAVQITPQLYRFDWQAVADVLGLTLRKHGLGKKGGDDERA